MKKSYIKWIVLLIILTIFLLVYGSLVLRILILHAASAFSFLGAFLIIYFFLHDAILQKCKKRRRLKSIIGACFIAGLCIFAYNLAHRPPSVVRMKEDVLYIVPKSTLKSNDEIYDGSKNDPNFKQDTINEK